MIVGLTLIVEQSLESVGLVSFYDTDPEAWLKAAIKSYTYLHEGLPSGTTIRRDDVSKALLTLVEAEASFRVFLASKRLTQKYWARHFTDLVVDRNWDSISSGLQP